MEDFNVGYINICTIRMRVVLLRPCKSFIVNKNRRKCAECLGLPQYYIVSCNELPLDLNPLELKSVEFGSLSTDLSNLNDLSKKVECDIPNVCVVFLYRNVYGF